MDAALLALRLSDMIKKKNLIEFVFAHKSFTVRANK